MYYAIGVSAPSLHRESTDSLIGECNGLLANNLSCWVCKNLHVCYFVHVARLSRTSER